MSRAAYAGLVLGALAAFIRYDLRNSLFGFQSVLGRVTRCRVAGRSSPAGTTAVICDAVALAACFYWKPVLCLQRSVAAALLLRKHGIDARLVIGYRSAPFFSHAWVEVEGRVVNDSPGYKAQLQVLCTA